MNPQRAWLISGFATLALSTALASAQAPGGQGGAPAPTRAQQVPLSGRTGSGGSVLTQQNPAGGSSSSVDTVTTTIQVQGPYMGSVPDPAAIGFSGLKLTLPDAIQRGLRFNLGVVGAGTSQRQVRAQRLSALSSLLPNVSASATYTELRSDLAAVGLTAGNIPAAGAIFPTTVGPYHYYDVHGAVSQSIFDKVALDNYASAKALEQASTLSMENARELVVLAVGGEYLRTLSDIALVDSQAAQVKYSQASYNQAAAQNRAGTKARVDTQRSLVELQTEQQRLSSDQADLEKQKLILLRVLGLPLRTDVELVETLSFHGTQEMPEQQAIQSAEAQRADLQAAASQLKAAEKALNAARSERLPSASIQASYGIEGINPNKGNGIFSAAGNVSVPIYSGGRIHSDIEQASAAVDQRRVEYQDQQQVVELDVRNALIDVRVAADQVRVAESNRKLALDTLKQSQDRFAEGVTDSVEVVQSTESLAAAERDYISSLYSHNVAKLSLARALGELEKDAPTILEER